jgi:uncharacterized protein (DUF2147 family)
MKTCIVTILALLLSVNIFAQSDEADKIRGYWLTQDNDAKIKIYRAKNGKYYGKITWLEEPNNPDGTPNVDDQNPDPKLRDQPVLGLLLLKSFTYNAKDKEWENGTIYDPENGNTYKCYMWFEDGNPDKLAVKGFIGFSLIGREVSWTRTTE